MMPVADTTYPMETVDYKKKYKTLKRKLKFLVYEHECFLEELRKAQRKLLKVTRDRSFLLDRLLQYEKIDDSSSDSDVTASSDSEAEGPRDGSSGKKKKLSQPAVALFNDASSLLTNMGYAAMLAPQAAAIGSQETSKTPEPAKKRAKTSKKAAKPAAGANTSSGQSSHSATLHAEPNKAASQMTMMTREELERHLEFKQSARAQFMSIDRTPNTLPDDIFSNENSNPDSDFGEVGQEDQGDDSDLVIDLPQD